MPIRQLLYLVMAAGLVLNVLVEWSNLYRPYDEGLEVTLSNRPVGVDVALPR